MMIRLRSCVRCAFWITIFATVTGATVQVSAGSLSAQQTQTPPSISRTAQSPTAAPVTPPPQLSATPARPPELANLESKVQPSVIWVTTFDQKGNLLRTETGFFISADGKVATTARAIAGGANGVIKMADGGIYNIGGILASSKESDVAVLQADVKPQKLVRFLDLNKTSELSVGGKVAVIGSALAGNDGSAREMTIAAEHGKDFELRGTTPANAAGSPVVDEAGAVVAILTSAGDKTVARSSSAVASLVSKVSSETRPRWLASAEGSPTPKPTPRPQIVYAPAPSFPPGMSQGAATGTGRFRLTFDPNGNVTNAQVVKSTGNPYFDQAAIKTLRQWRSAPSRGWDITVPVTFRTR